mmetsp:Transcript_48954/g.121483  ORF Transcript_48954/g.121483 Transcript_48954/m.121483 type:complete len:223 (-) Transcript_48954:344-1012(-)
MSTSPSRWSASTKDPLASSLRTLRRWRKCVRPANSSAIASTSLRADEAYEPTQKVRPLCTSSTARRMCCTSLAVETTRGRPSSGMGGSSGWMAKYTPTSAATGTMARRKCTRLARSVSASMLAYALSCFLNSSSVYASTILPGSPAMMHLVMASRFSADISSKRAEARALSSSGYSCHAPSRCSRWSSNATKSTMSNARARLPSGHAYSRSVRVQSMIGMKL